MKWYFVSFHRKLFISRISPFIIYHKKKSQFLLIEKNYRFKCDQIFRPRNGSVERWKDSGGSWDGTHFLWREALLGEVVQRWWNVAARIAEFVSFAVESRNRVEIRVATSPPDLKLPAAEDDAFAVRWAVRKRATAGLRPNTAPYFWTSRWRHTRRQLFGGRGEENRRFSFSSSPPQPEKKGRRTLSFRLIVESPLCPSSLRDSLYLSLFFFFLRIIIKRKRTYDINLKNGKGEGDRESKIKGTLDFARFMYVYVYVR